MLDLSSPAHWNSMGIWKLGLTDWIFSPPPTETRLKYENWASRADLHLLRPLEKIERFGHTYEKPKRAAHFTTIFRLKFDVLGVEEKN